jgi:hypothetical protein
MIPLLHAYEYKKVNHYQMGPGTYYSYYEEKTRPWALYVVEIDITNPYVNIETAKGGNRLLSRDIPSNMSKSNNYAGHRVISAINGDYYHTSGEYLNAPVTSQVMNGQFVWGFSNNRSAFSFNEDKKPHIINPQFTGALYASDSSGLWFSYPLSNVNFTRGTDQMVFYNRYKGASTGTNVYGFECQANPIDDWIVNDTVRAVIESRVSGVGNMAIPDGKIVISGHGAANTFMNNYLQIGDTVKIVQGLANNLPRLTQLVGGGPRMLQDGVDVVAASYPNEGIGSAHCSDRHPRTAIGFNQDSTKVYFVVVDGRQAGFSVGMSLYEMAAFMKDVGIAHAVNLDGGGSSSIVVWNSQMNSPSDGSERSVSNGVLCVSSAPDDGDLKHIQFVRDSIAVYKKQTISTGLTGWSEYYHLRGFSDWNALTIDYNTAMGSFSEGNFTASTTHGNTKLVATLNTEGESDSVLIHVIELTDLEISPKYVTTDSSKTIRFSVAARDESGYFSVMSSDIFEFELLNPAVGSINERVEFKATASGQTALLVKYGNNTDTAYINIEIGEGESAIDEVEDMNDYTVSADEFIDLTQTGFLLVDRTEGSGSKAIKVDYSHIGTATDGNIYLSAKDPVTIYGLPSEILIDALGDSVAHSIYVTLEDGEGKAYEAKASTSLLYNDDYRTLICPMNALLPYDRAEVYPMKYKGFRLRINRKASSGSIYVDRVRVIYPTWTSIEKDVNIHLPAIFRLEQNYPNPFNPETRIGYSLTNSERVTLDIFDIRGKYVQTLVYAYQSPGSYTVHFRADHLPAGIYYYRLSAGLQTETKKMLLIK